MSELNKADIAWCQNIYKRHNEFHSAESDPVYELAYAATYNHQSHNCEHPERLSAVLVVKHGYYGNWAFFKDGHYVCSLSKDILTKAVSTNEQEPRG